MSTSRTVHFHRILRAPPERVYRALLDADAMCKWLPPHGFTGKVEHLDATVGGTFRMSFSQLSNGSSHHFGGEYLELVPGRRIRHTDRFDDPAMPGTITVTIDLEPVMMGTEVRIEQRDIPEPIPLEFCILGWQESLALLALLVEGGPPG